MAMIRIILFAERTCKNISYETLKGKLAAPTVSRGQLRYTQWARSLERDLVDLVPDKDLYTSLFASVEKLLVSLSFSGEMINKAEL